MNYKELTVYNYKISYFGIRIFTLYWLYDQLNFYKIFLKRPTDFYIPNLWLQKVFFLVFPSEFYFYSLVTLCVISLIISVLKPNVLFNVICFILIGLINLPIRGYHGLSHTNHVLILCFFFSIFLIPKKLKENDYKYVQFYYAGLLITYSLAGFWKFISMAKDIVSRDPDISWLELNAAKLNTFTNYHFADLQPPEYILKLYEYPKLWIFITITGILFQTLSIFGAFSRKFLNFTLFFLLCFHFYTKYFVIADLMVMKYGLIVLFFPYHYFKKYFDVIWAKVYRSISYKENFNLKN